MNSNIISLLIKKEWADNRKPILLGTLVVWGTFILIGAFLATLTLDAAAEIFLMTFFGGLAMSVGTSMAFGNMKTKEGRINMLMLPASTAEKFMVRWIAAIPLVLIVIVAGYFLGDAARVLIMKFDHHSTVSLWSWLGSNAGSEFNIAILWVICLIIFNQACYFLGAIVWPKLSFIKTFATLQIIQLLGGYLIMLTKPYMIIKYVDSGEAILWLLIGFTVVFSLGLYWLAYVRFRRSEVTYKLF